MGIDAKNGRRFLLDKYFPILGIVLENELESISRIHEFIAESGFLYPILDGNRRESNGRNKENWNQNLSSDPGFNFFSRSSPVEATISQISFSRSPVVSINAIVRYRIR